MTPGCLAASSVTAGDGLRPTTHTFTGSSRCTSGNTSFANQVMPSTLGSQSIDPVNTSSCPGDSAPGWGWKNSASTPVGIDDVLVTPYSRAMVAQSCSLTMMLWSNQRAARPS